MNGLLIVGGGFAGMWAAVTAARERAAAGADFPIRVICPDGHIVVRPRLYEVSPADFRIPLAPTLDPVGVNQVEGIATAIDTATNTVAVDGAQGPVTLTWDSLILAAGSVLKPLPVPGLAEHGFDIDTWDGAMRLDAHLAALTHDRRAGARAVAIIGGGFTGIELALEMRDRLAAHGAHGEAATILLVEKAEEIGPELGPGPRGEIVAALADARVDVRVGSAVERVTDDSLTLAGGEIVPCRTVVNTTGMRANPLARSLGVPLDDLGRLPTDEMLRVDGVADIFAAGDIAHARVDDAGHVALMSCQHAMPMGKAAGYNAARSLLGLGLRPYRQERYVTCLDLGRRGAVLTAGWDREVQATGAEAKERKQMINGQIIYPPTGSRDDILAAGDIDRLPGR